jgi:hypothetical protein
MLPQWKQLLLVMWHQLRLRQLKVWQVVPQLLQLLAAPKVCWQRWAMPWQAVR